MNIVVHIERLIVDSGVLLDAGACELAVRQAIAEAALFQATLSSNERGSLLLGDWAAQFVRSVHDSAGRNLGAETPHSASGENGRRS